MAVDRETVRTVDAVDGDRGLAGAAVGVDRDRDDLVVAGVVGEERRALVVELDAVGAEGRKAARGQARIRKPDLKTD